MIGRLEMFFSQCILGNEGAERWVRLCVNVTQKEEAGD
jgi:hypothetical protein